MRGDYTTNAATTDQLRFFLVAMDYERLQRQAIVALFLANGGTLPAPGP